MNNAFSVNILLLQTQNKILDTVAAIAPEVGRIKTREIQKHRHFQGKYYFPVVMGVGKEGAESPFGKKAHFDILS